MKMGVASFIINLRISLAIFVFFSSVILDYASVAALVPKGGRFPLKDTTVVLLN